MSTSIFSNPYFNNNQTLKKKIRDELAFQRPVFFGLATEAEINRMGTKQVAELNEAAIQLEEEQAEILSDRISNRLAELLAPLFGGTSR